MKWDSLPILLCATMALAAEATIDPPPESLLVWPTWDVDAINSAEPTAWASSFEYNSAFDRSVELEMLEGTMPAWYNSLPESVKAFESTRNVALESWALAHNSHWYTNEAWYTSTYPTATAPTTATATATVATATSSSSIGQGVSAPANGVMMPMAGAVGILCIALAL
ncbi:hypothetical protein PMG11_10719 [Penicillium brasilianum]|uniref:GPI anchored protein n=1 Tax=Penicillium brasilianum TaxID=104259 RepID=A0A0F7U490_PENBI|nr:hypothetical protein PMG11_10719 [Penicillium brasilianum]